MEAIGKEVFSIPIDQGIIISNPLYPPLFLRFE